MYSARMNGRKLPEKLYADIFLWFPRKIEEDGWSQMTETSRTHTHTSMETHTRTDLSIGHWKEQTELPSYFGLRCFHLLHLWQHAEGTKDGFESGNDSARSLESDEMGMGNAK